MVHQAAGRADHHMNTAFQLSNLPRVSLATVNWQHMESLDMGCVTLEGFRDLNGQLSGRG